MHLIWWYKYEAQHYPYSSCKGGRSLHFAYLFKTSEAENGAKRAKTEDDGDAEWGLGKH
jgi:hypothetical protein